MTVLGHRAATGLPAAIALTAMAVLIAGGAAAASAVGGTGWILLAVGAAAATLAALTMPGLVLGLYFLIPLYKGGIQPFSPVDLTLLLAIANAAQIVPLLIARRRLEISVGGLALWGAFALLMLAGILWAPDRDAATSRTIAAWSLLFLPVVPGALRVGSDERYLRQLVLTFLVAGVVTVALGIAALSSSERLVVFDTNTIQTARAALLFPLLAMLFVPQQPSTLLRWVALVGSVLAVLVALASGSRGPVMALLGIGAVGLVWRVATSRGPGARTLLGTALLAAIGVAIVASGSIDLPSVSTQRFATFGDFLGSITGGGETGGFDDESAGARLLLFGFAIDLFASSPFIGTGTGGYPALSPAALGHFEANAYPHNAILQVAAEYGLLGVSILVALIFLALTRRLPERSWALGVRLLFVFYLLNAMVSGDVFDDRVTWGLAMLVLLTDLKRPVASEPLPGGPAATQRPAPKGPPAGAVLP